MIREFEAAIAKGPMFAKVDDVATKEIEGSYELLGNAEGFERDEDGETPWTT